MIIHHETISAYSINHKSLVLNDDQSDHLSDDISSSNIWPEINEQQNYIPSVPNFDLRRGIIRIIPYKKRTIPLELQKALYAHGIVGRRR